MQKRVNCIMNLGFRTLCYAMARISEKDYIEWNLKYEEAALSLEDREMKLEVAANLIEKNLMLVGATAIEDKLQDGVPGCIKLLLEAGIKIWVLTGDKTETAVNIGYSCNLIPSCAILLIIRGASVANDEGTTLEQIENAMKVIEKAPSASLFALIIDGNALIYVLETEISIKEKFLSLATSCIAVMCCRVSPKQKARIVRLIKERGGTVTLAIGDGANDVSMIQEAHVGIGIAGEEGMQASMAADYAIGQFRFLAKLLLVEGRWCYSRMASLISNFFYKNVAYKLIMINSSMPLFIFQFYSGFSASTLFEQSFMIFANTLFSSLPVGVMGGFDKDIDAGSAMKYPKLYQLGISGSAMNEMSFLAHSLEAVYHAIIIFFITTYSFADEPITSVGQLNDISILDAITFIYTMWTIDIAVFMNTYDWSWITVFGLTFSIFLTFIYTIVFSATPGLIGSKLDYLIFRSINFWLTFVLVITVCLAPRTVYFYLQRLLAPTDTQIIQECYKKLRPETVDVEVYTPEDILKLPSFSVSVKSPRNNEFFDYPTSADHALPMDRISMERAISHDKETQREQMNVVTDNCIVVASTEQVESPAMFSTERSTLEITHIRRHRESFSLPTGVVPLLISNPSIRRHSEVAPRRSSQFSRIIGQDVSYNVKRNSTRL